MSASSTISGKQFLTIVAALVLGILAFTSVLGSTRSAFADGDVTASAVADPVGGTSGTVIAGTFSAEDGADLGSTDIAASAQNVENGTLASSVDGVECDGNNVGDTGSAPNGASPLNDSGTCQSPPFGGGLDWLDVTAYVSATANNAGYASANGHAFGDYDDDAYAVSTASANDGTAASLADAVSDSGPLGTCNLDAAGDVLDCEASSTATATATNGGDANAAAQTFATMGQTAVGTAISDASGALANSAADSQVIGGGVATSQANALGDNNSFADAVCKSLVNNPIDTGLGNAFEDDVANVAESNCNAVAVDSGDAEASGTANATVDSFAGVGAAANAANGVASAISNATSEAGSFAIANTNSIANNGGDASAVATSTAAASSAIIENLANASASEDGVAKATATANTSGILDDDGFLIIGAVVLDNTATAVGNGGTGLASSNVDVQGGFVAGISANASGTYGGVATAGTDLVCNGCGFPPGGFGFPFDAAGITSDANATGEGSSASAGMTVDLGAGSSAFNLQAQADAIGAGSNAVASFQASDNGGETLLLVTNSLAQATATGGGDAQAGLTTIANEGLIAGLQSSANAGGEGSTAVSSVSATDQVSDIFFLIPPAIIDNTASATAMGGGSAAAALTANVNDGGFIGDNSAVANAAGGSANASSGLSVSGEEGSITDTASTATGAAGGGASSSVTGTVIDGGEIFSLNANANSDGDDSLAVSSINASANGNPVGELTASTDASAGGSAFATVDVNNANSDDEISDLNAVASANGAGSVAAASVDGTSTGATDDIEQIAATADASAGGSAFSGVNFQCDDCAALGDLSTSAASAGAGSLASAGIGVDAGSEGNVTGLGAVASADAAGTATASFNATAQDNGATVEGGSALATASAGAANAAVIATALNEGDPFDLSDASLVENASASASADGTGSKAGAGVVANAIDGGSITEPSANASAAGAGSVAGSNVSANASDSSVTLGSLQGQITSPLEGSVDGLTANSNATTGGLATASVTGNAVGGTVNASTADASASTGGNAGAIQVTEAIFGGVADGQSLAVATDHGIATSIGECKATGTIVPTEGGTLLDGGDAQCDTIAAADGTSLTGVPSIAVSQTSGLSATGSALPIAMSGAANGGVATSNSIASDLAPSNAEGEGWSVAGGCRVFVGCSLAVGIANANDGGSDSAMAVTVSQVNQAPFMVGGASLASSFGGDGQSHNDSGSGYVAGVGGAFNISHSTGSVSTISVVGTNATGGFDGDPLTPQ